MHIFLDLASDEPCFLFAVLHQCQVDSNSVFVIFLINCNRYIFHKKVIADVVDDSVLSNMVIECIVDFRLAGQL